MKVFGRRSDEGKADFDGMEAIKTRITSRLIFSISRMTVSLSLKTSSPLLSALPFPSYPTGPGGVWCDVDVVEFSYFGAPEPAPKEQLYTEIVDYLRGSGPCIGSGCQSATLRFKRRLTFGSWGDFYA
ncbi:hypothetical protein Dimus_030856 [Dionaea muscipula]